MSVATLDTGHVEAIFMSGQDIKAIANHVPNVYAESSSGRTAIVAAATGLVSGVAILAGAVGAHLM